METIEEMKNNGTKGREERREDGIASCFVSSDTTRRTAVAEVGSRHGKALR